jgi:hypothetical protein
MGSRGALCLLAVAGCGVPINRGAIAQDLYAGPPPAPPVAEIGVPPVVNLGPDLRFRVLCGSTSEGAFASVSSPDGHSVEWTATIAGDPAWSLSAPSPISTTTDTTVLSAQFAPPLTAEPGDTFDAHVTVQVLEGSLRTGTVNLHGEVVQQVVIADPAALDFGDVVVGQNASHALAFQTTDASDAWLVAPNGLAPFVVGAPTSVALALIHKSVAFGVTASSQVEGDVRVEADFGVVASPFVPSVPPSCTRNTTKVILHANFVAAPDGGV